jgi:uncharacterized protein (DUF1499 family)
MSEAPDPRDAHPAAPRPFWRRAALVLVATLALVLSGAQMGLLAGKRPARLGPVDGQLQPVRAQLSNSVSSTATTDYHRIAPLDAGPDPKAAFARLRAVIGATAGAQVVTETPGYLHVEFRTRWLGFVDDAEFLLDAPAGTIQVRSASRLGRKDFGVNRARIEAIRARLAG